MAKFATLNRARFILHFNKSKGRLKLAISNDSSTDTKIKLLTVNASPKTSGGENVTKRRSTAGLIRYACVFGACGRQLQVDERVLKVYLAYEIEPLLIRW
jgi:hypothetical protein